MGILQRGWSFISYLTAAHLRLLSHALKTTGLKENRACIYYILAKQTRSQICQSLSYHRYLAPEHMVLVATGYDRDVCEVDLSGNLQADSSSVAPQHKDRVQILQNWIIQISQRYSSRTRNTVDPFTIL